MIKVMIADDQELIRQSLQIVLEMKEGIEVTATAKDGREVIQEVRKDKPDVIPSNPGNPSHNRPSSYRFPPGKS